MCKLHFEDKVRTCSNCRKEVIIKFNQVGGYWFLRGYEDKKGNKHTGGYCSDCFDLIKGD